MSVAWYIVLEKRIAVFDAFVNGKALARAAEKLDYVAKQHSVRPLMSFFSSSREQLLAFTGSEGVETGTEIAETWFVAEEGLQTVNLLLEKMEGDSAGEAVRKDLLDFRRVLETAKQHGARWHLAIDF
ncbi:MAG TPA: hypothetical protein VKP58_14910 [Candidatus Acidoferrum sp.]|nr:hypothetical protein [Candidatus Acidoferrum sp.]